MAISMDGRGRALDNVFVERLWRSVKYEEVYLKDYADGWEAEAVAGRATSSSTANAGMHQALGYRTPAEVYGGRGSSHNGRRSEGKHIEVRRKHGGDQTEPSPYQLQQPRETFGRGLAGCQPKHATSYCQPKTVQRLGSTSTQAAHWLAGMNDA